MLSRARFSLESIGRIIYILQEEINIIDNWNTVVRFRSAKRRRVMSYERIIQEVD